MTPAPDEGTRVAAALECIRRALDAAAPDLAKRLRAPASTADIERAERELGGRLPAVLEKLYATADGDGDALDDGTDRRGLLLGAIDGPSWVRLMRVLPPREVARAIDRCRDTMTDSFRATWIPVATDDNGNFVIVDARDGKVFALDHETPGDHPERRLAASLADLLEEVARGLEDGTVRCDATGLFRSVAPKEPPREPAYALISLLVERGIVVLGEDHRLDEGVPEVRKLLAARSRTATKAAMLLDLLDEAAWVEESFASEDVLEVVIREFS